MIELILKDQHNHIIFEGKINKLSIPKSLIKEKSMAWFQDPDPCFIHQSAVRKRLLIALEDALMHVDQSVTIHQVSHDVLTTLGFYENLYTIHMG
ncbi:hypothetical protein HZI73_08250 [Vallitalea pronyensis]|uniref:Uncharacterized protein n=1 Tax=Vallitalea pronyensis TaxID=1348613 RepID=A0A8J8SGG4_9FIRM|nr:hypothetical protein [Vallitalea pronyensis]QUI22288.1 hypothetical protein HZI73_08250 [Vallitalea pronyensis]